MNESDFENELRALRPAPPSPALELAIARELEAEPAPRALAVRPAAGIIVPEEKRPRFFLGGLAWAFGGAVLAALAIFAAPPSWMGRAPGLAGAPPAAVETAFFEPLDSAREVVATEKSEIFYDGDDGPSQVVRYSSVEWHSWTNPSTGALVEVEVPREDFFLVPVTYQ